MNKKSISIFIIFYFVNLLLMINVSASSCPSKFEKMTCKRGSAHSYLYEAKNLGINNDNYKCLINGKDDLGDSYIIDETKGNEYCSIYCKEDIDIYYQGLGYNPNFQYDLLSGTYFNFEPYIKNSEVMNNLPTIHQSRTCLFVLKTEKFVKDLYGINDNCNCNNTSKISRNASGGYYHSAYSELKKYFDARNAYTSAKSSLSGISWSSANFKANQSKVQQITSLILSLSNTMSNARANYEINVKKMKKAIKDYNQCNIYNNNYKMAQDRPNVENFYYDDQKSSRNENDVFADIEIVKKSEEVIEPGNKQYCQEINSQLNCDVGDMSVRSIPLFIDKLRVNGTDFKSYLEYHYYDSPKITFYTFAKDVAATKSEFGPNNHFYSLKPVGDVFVKGGSANSGKVLINQYNDIGFSLPIGILTKGGKYDYEYSITQLGKLNNMLKKYEKLNSTVKYKCHYYVSNEVMCSKSEECILTNESICKINEDCKPATNKIKDVKYTPLAREINIEDINPNDRELGRNWSDEKGISAVNRIDEKKKEIYLEPPMYTFTLNGEIMKEIKEYNKSNPYSDFNLKCLSGGTHCESYFVTTYSNPETTNKAREIWFEYNYTKKTFENIKD